MVSRWHFGLRFRSISVFYNCSLTVSSDPDLQLVRTLVPAWTADAVLVSAAAAVVEVTALADENPEIEEDHL